jgi:hypothetical protein
MRKDNTQNYQTSTSRISHFRDYTDNIHSEKDELETVNRQYTKNDDDRYNLPDLKKLRFNKVTRKMDDLSQGEVQDTIKSLEDEGVKKTDHKYKVQDDAVNPNHFFKNKTEVKESKIKSFEAFTGGFGYNNNEMTPKPDVMGNPDLGDDAPLEDPSAEEDADMYSDEMLVDNEDGESFHEGNTKSYMFFGNLESLNRMAHEISTMDEGTINNLLNEGHNWAEDHVSAAKEMVSQVYNFMENLKLEDMENQIGDGGDNYMFFGNIKNIITQTEELLQADESGIDEILSEHDWAEDHMASAKEDIQQVYEFLKSEIE